MAGFDSLYTGITGLNAYQSWIDMISNNIANVDTTGFKGQSMTFADLFYQNQSFASAPTTSLGGIDGQQLGFGVKVNTVDTNFGQGGLQTTGVNTNLAINGDGFFILGTLNGSQAPVYTRDGDFSLNSNGVLYDPASGLAVQGWMANSQGVVTPGGATGNLTIPIGLTEQATATGAGTKVGPTGDDVFDVALGGNLDQTQWQQQFLNSINASTNPGTAYTISTTIYDSLGNAHEATITYIPDTTGSQAASANVTAGPGNLTSGPTVAAATNISDTITATVTSPNTYQVVDTATGVNMSVNAGSVVTVDGTSFTLKANGAGFTTIQVNAAQNGLPSVVANSAGVNDVPATRWKVEVSFTDGTTFSAITQGGVATNGALTTGATYSTVTSGVVGYAYFDQNGQFINTSSIEDATGAAGISGTGLAGELHSDGEAASIAQGNQLNIQVWGTSAGNNAQAPTAGGPAPTPGPIALGFWQNTSLAGNEGTVAAGTQGYSARVISQNGYAAGTLDNITIGDDGTITGAFTNGQNKTLGQVAIARFANEDGLERLGDNQFAPTANSGLAQVGVAGTGVNGTIQSGALEQSNVSLSTEFVNLIVAQRAYEANTRGISTADQNLQTVINLRASEN